MISPKKFQISLLVSLFLLLGTFCVFWPVKNHQFVNYDDDRYVTANPFVPSGLTRTGVFLAFTTVAVSNWHPFTWLSHMLDCELYGLKPAGHHLTNLVFHTANVILLFLLLRKMTGAVWRSAIVAALFAWHPLHVESVAWVAERKDVLSGFFGLACFWCYAAYVQKLEKCPSKARSLYGSALALFLFGLLSKPMIVTWPFVMLLLDYWPLQRIKNFRRTKKNSSPGADQRTFAKLVIEKLPFFALSLASCIITYSAQNRSGAVATSENFPIIARLINAVVSLARYIGKTVWPEKLAVFYPHPIYWPVPIFIGAALLVAAITIIVVRQRSRRPYLLMGWLWFLGTLMPVIGLVQVGQQAMADRYTYIPLIGLFLMIVWSAAELAHRHRAAKTILSIASTIVLAGCLFLTSRQLKHWQNSKALFEHALATTQRSYVAHHNLASAFFANGDYSRAAQQFDEALKINPRHAPSHFVLGNTLIKLGEPQRALNSYHSAITCDPNYAEAQVNLASTLTDLGRFNEAATHFENALRLQPNAASHHYYYSVALRKAGKIDDAFKQGIEAIRLQPSASALHRNLAELLALTGQTNAALLEFEQALTFDPTACDTRIQFGTFLENLGKSDEAIAQYQEALRQKPDSAHAHSNLAVALRRCGKIAEAREHFQAVVSLDPNNPDAHYNLGNILSELSKYSDAAGHFSTAIRLNPADSRAVEKLNRLKEHHPELNL